MTYSIRARGADKTAAMADLDAKFDEVVKTHPNHVLDRALMTTAAAAAVDLLHDTATDGFDVMITASGSIDGQVNGDVFDVGAVQVSISVCHVHRDQT